MRQKQFVVCWAMVVGTAAIGGPVPRGVVTRNPADKVTEITAPKEQQNVHIVVWPEPPTAMPIVEYQPRELLPYMTARCAQLYEAQLNGNSRRTSATVAAGVRTEFQSNCVNAEFEARQSLTKAKLGKYQSTQEQKLAAKASADQDRTTKEQCDEMLRILASKRKRLNAMTEGEQADHARFESIYADRCKGR